MRAWRAPAVVQPRRAAALHAARIALEVGSQRIGIARRSGGVDRRVHEIRGRGEVRPRLLAARTRLVIAIG